VVSTTQVQFLVSGNNQSSRVNSGRSTAAEALKQANELLGRGNMDMKMCAPRGRILLLDEFDQLEG
jgi:hypothetical protein